MPFPHDYGPGTDLASHAAIQAIRFALRERSQATGGGLYWPRQNKIAGAGTITSMTATTMTDSAAHWMVPNPNGGGGLVQRYYDYRVDAAPYFPRFYDLILDSDNPDPSKHVRVRPSTHDDNTATFATIQDSVTSNFLPSVASLVGKRYAWIKRGGLWWSDRWPRTPNDDEAWRGTGDAVTIVALTPSPSGPLPSMPLGATLSVGPATAPTGSYAILEGDAATVTIPWTAVALTGGARILSSTGTVLATVTIGALIDGLRNPLIQFKPSSMSGKELVAGSPVRRQAITGNSSTTIRFARQAYGVAGNFSVVRAGGRAWPGRLADEPFVWYGGATAAYATHFPSDSIVALDVSFVQMPLDRVTWSVSGGDPPTCTDVAHDAFDLDVWSEYDETCSEPDDCKSPDFYKSLRGCQIEVEDLCANFVDPTRNFTGDKSIPTLRFATLCALCNINPAGTLTATADGDGALTFSTGHASTYLYYALFDENGANAGDGLIGTSPTGTIALGGIAGKAYSLVLAFGWSRYPIREFAFAYPRSAFIPDIRTDDDGNRFIVDPPTEEYPGTWYDRPASTGYRSTSRLGFSEDSGGAFEAGVRARYVGTTWQDPAVDPPSSGPDDTIDAAYYASFWEGKFRKDLDPAYQASKSGKVAYAGATWVRTDPRWFNGPIGAGVLRTEAGTATGGSATTLVDTSKTVIDADSGLPRTSGYWDFPAGAGPLQGDDPRSHQDGRQRRRRERSGGLQNADHRAPQFYADDPARRRVRHPGNPRDFDDRASAGDPRASPYRRRWGRLPHPGTQVSPELVEGPHRSNHDACGQRERARRHVQRRRHAVVGRRPRDRRDGRDVPTR